jgi:hypothetical protein
MQHAPLRRRKWFANPLKKLDQPWGFVLAGVVLLVAVVALLFLVFYQK